MIASKWKTLLTEYVDVFEAPGKPISRTVDHRIDLIDLAAPPPHLQSYKILEDEFIAVKHSDYIDGGWIRPSSSLYGDPVKVIHKKNGRDLYCN